MRNKLKFITTLILFFLVSTSTQAVELYSFFNKQCKETIGYLISEQDDTYHILSVDGSLANLHVDDFKGVLIYNVINPPLRTLSLGKEYIDKIVTLSIQSEGKIDTFSGFPIQFIEDLVLFLGIDGSVRVHKIDSILKIRPFKGKKVALSKKNFNLSIRSAGYMQSCQNSGRKGLLRPNRILIDKIKIYQFLSNYKVGYEGFKSFQERTYLYARPIIYNQETKFGLISQNRIEKSSFTEFPFIEWYSGKPFRVQSLTQMGSIFNEYGADLDPILGLKAEVKAHFFHSAFVGNLESMYAGNPLFIRGKVSEDHTKVSYTDSGFNYMALVGGDFGAHSFSIILYYPIYVFGSGSEVREVLSTSNSYALRYMYTNKFLRFYGLHP